MQENLRALGLTLQEAAAHALYQEAETIMADSKEHYVPADLSTLKNSGFVRLPVVEGSTVSVEMGYGGAASKYAVYVHEGTGPAVGRPQFMPPVKVIRAWMRRHGLDEKLAFVYARAIGRRGLRPSKYLEQPVNAARAGLTERLAERIRAGIERLAARTGVRP